MLAIADQDSPHTVTVVQTLATFARDAIFGAAVGAVAGRTVTVGRGTARLALSPTTVPGSAGVVLRHLD